MVKVKTEELSMDGTSVKIHPDVAGARKKTVLSPSAFPAEAETPKFIRLPQMTE
jgi:hypothetical protein